MPDLDDTSLVFQHWIHVQFQHVLLTEISLRKVEAGDSEVWVSADAELAERG